MEENNLKNKKVNKTIIKISTLILIIITLFIFILFVLRIVSDLFFWVYVAIIALFAYKVLPKFKKYIK